MYSQVWPENARYRLYLLSKKIRNYQSFFREIAPGSHSVKYINNVHHHEKIMHEFGCNDQ